MKRVKRVEIEDNEESKEGAVVLCLKEHTRTYELAGKKVKRMRSEEGEKSEASEKMAVVLCPKKHTNMYA